MLSEIVFGADVALPRAPQSDNHATTKSYVDGVVAGKAASSHTHTASEIADIGTAAICNTGTSSGNVPVLGSGGLLEASVIPAVAITDTFTVDSESAMLALTAQKGDVAIRTDVSKTLILTADGASTLANWSELKSPTAAVSSVNGSTGAVNVAAVPSGGTSGQVLTKTASGYEWAESSSATYSGTITGNGSSKSFEVSHNMNFSGVSAEIFLQDGATLVPIVTLITRSTANKITIDFAVAPTNGAVYTVIVRK